MAEESSITKKCRAKGSGTFKKKTRVRKRDGSKVVYWEGYVYASDGKKVYGSGPSARKAEMAALQNKNNYEQALQSAAFQIVSMAKSENAFRDLTVQKAVSSYIARKSYRYNTRRKYEGFLSAMEKAAYLEARRGQNTPTLASFPINEVTEDLLEDFLFGYRARWTENSTYNIHVFIKQVFKYAKNKKKWIVGDNPAAELEPRKKTRRKRVPMPDWLMNRLIDLCEHPQLKCFLLLSSYALRAGETAAMTENAIIGPYTLYVQYTQAWLDNDLNPHKEPDIPKSTLGLSEPKSEYGYRPIEVAPEDWWIVERSLEHALDDSVLTYDKGRISTRFLMPNKHGGQWRTDHIRRALKAFLSSLDDKRVKSWAHGAGLPHTWRASVITNLLDGDEDGIAPESLAAVQKFVGHSRVDITGDLYHQASTHGRLKVSRKIGQKRRVHRQEG